MNGKAAMLVAIAIFAVMFLSMCIIGIAHQDGIERSVHESGSVCFDLRDGDGSRYEMDADGMYIEQRFGLSEESGLYRLAVQSILSGRAADRIVMDCSGESRMDGLSISSGGTMEVCQSSIAGGIMVTATDGTEMRFSSGFVSQFRGNGSAENDVSNVFYFRMYGDQCEIRIWMSVSYGDDAGEGSISQEFRIRIFSDPLNKVSAP